MPEQQAPLLLTRSDDPNRFAGFLAELLRMEGLNWFDVRDLARQPLRRGEKLPPLALLSAVSIGDDEARVLFEHVTDGGSLLACRPGRELATDLGLDGPYPLPPEWSGRYVMLDDESPDLAGLPWEAGGVQFHGPVSTYLVGEGSPWLRPAAWLAPFPGQRTRFPALLAGEVGPGRTAVFAYDPAESAVRQQQGRPDQASTGALPDFDGDTTFRPNDLFLGQLDPQLRDVPQADLQRTLLMRVVEWLSEAFPLPRLWRFPANARAAALLDGDSDGMSREDFFLAVETCDRYQAPFATYLMVPHVPLLEPEEERALRDRGHRFGPHPWASPRPSVAEMRGALEENCSLFAARFGYRPRIHRGHWLVWPGWVDHARSLQAAGIRLDANFAAGRNFQGGYVNGTGLPARFVTEEGEVMSTFEQSTISTDDGWLLGKTGLPAHTLATAISRSYAQIDSALERYHTVYHPYFHPVSLKGGRSLPYPTLPWLDAVLAHLRRRGLPILDAEQWIDWNDARRAVTFHEVTHDTTISGGVTRVTVRAEHAVEALTVLLPLPAHAKATQALVDGEAAHRARQDDQASDDSNPGSPETVRHGRRYATTTLTLRAGERRTVAIRWQRT